MKVVVESVDCGEVDLSKAVDENGIILACCQFVERHFTEMGNKTGWGGPGTAQRLAHEAIKSIRADVDRIIPGGLLRAEQRMDLVPKVVREYYVRNDIEKRVKKIRRGPDQHKNAKMIYQAWMPLPENAPKTPTQ